MEQGFFRNQIEKFMFRRQAGALVPDLSNFIQKNIFPDRSVSPRNLQEFDLDSAYKAVMDHRSASTIRVAVPFPYRESLREAIALDHQFVEHRKDPNYGWYALALHGTAPDHTNDYYHYGFKTREEAGYQWTEVADKCPVTTQWLKEVWPYDTYFRVRFVKLAPGGFITPHNDTGGERGYFAVNVCLNQPVGCFMVMDGFGIVPWSPGDIRLMDIGLNHAVVNLSNKDRYHMIIHGHSHSPEAHQRLKRLIVAGVG